MNEDLKNTAKHTFIYSLGNLSVKLVGLLLLPIYTSKLSSTEYGYLSFFEITAVIVGIIISMNIRQALMRWYGDANSEDDKKTVVTTTLVMIIISLFFFNIVLQPFSHYFSISFFNRDDFSLFFNIMFTYVSIDALNGIVMSTIRMKEKSKLFILLNLLKLVVSLSFNILFLVKYSMGVKGILLSQLIASSLNFIVILPMLLKDINRKVDKRIISPMFRYAISLSFASISFILLDSSDNYMLKFMTNDANLGIYSLAYKIVGMLNFFILQSFKLAFLPIAYKIYKQENSKQIFSKILTYLVIVLSFAALGLVLFSKEFLMIFSPKNQQLWDAARYVPLLSFGVILFAIRFMYSLGFLISKKNIYMPIIVTFGVILNIGLNLILIKKMEIMGAAISTVLTSFVLNVFYYKFSYKFFKVKYEMRKIWLIVGITAVLYGLSFFIHFGVIVDVGLKIVILMMFPLCIYFLGFLNPKEKGVIRMLLKNIRNYQYIKLYFLKLLK